MTGNIQENCIALLRSMIAIPSISREEKDVADFLESRMVEWGLHTQRLHNNIWVKNFHWDSAKPVILLNSHIDTVRPATGWTYNPFYATEEGEKITGLGSNDAGASVVALLGTFLHQNQKDHLPYNLIFCASAEEEISGINGMSAVLPEFGKIDLAIVGEPTRMQMAIAEKGLMVLDCEAKGKAGHAARNEGDNAIYRALEDIKLLQEYQFPLQSDLLGPVKLTVTQITAGHQHNMIPDSCKYVVDVRTNEFYSNQDVFGVISGLLKSEVKARSFRLNSSGIKPNHPFIKRGLELGLTTFGSPTTSDQAVIPYPSIKIGPGDSSRSHTANEYIYKSEISEGIEIYLNLLQDLKI
jgi:acetylornithine deacetylase